MQRILRLERLLYVEFTTKSLYFLTLVATFACLAAWMVTCYSFTKVPMTECSSMWILINAQLFCVCQPLIYFATLQAQKKLSFTVFWNTLKVDQMALCHPLTNANSFLRFIKLRYFPQSMMMVNPVQVYEVHDLHGKTCTSPTYFASLSTSISITAPKLQVHRIFTPKEGIM